MRDAETTGQTSGADSDLTERVIGCAYQVSNGLGIGFLEKVYENALAHELRKLGLHTEQQVRIVVRYDGVVVGDYVADMIVDGRVMVEIKTVRELGSMHRAQCLNYLRATGLTLCLLINFGKSRVEVKRVSL